LVEKELRTMNETLKGCSLADVLEKLEKGKIGHRAAMEWLNIESQDELVESPAGCRQSRWSSGASVLATFLLIRREPVARRR
jgi:hypothetical protein